MQEMDQTKYTNLIMMQEMSQTGDGSIFDGRRAHWIVNTPAAL